MVQKMPQKNVLQCLTFYISHLTFHHLPLTIHQSCVKDRSGHEVKRMAWPDRGRFMQYMTENGVATAQHYPVPCHLQKAYSFLQYKKGDFPKSEYLAEHCVSLPMFAELTDNEVHKIINLVNNFK